MIDRLLVGVLLAPCDTRVGAVIMTPRYFREARLKNAIESTISTITAANAVRKLSGRASAAGRITGCIERSFFWATICSALTAIKVFFQTRDCTSVAARLDACV